MDEVKKVERWNGGTSGGDIFFFFLMFNQVYDL